MSSLEPLGFQFRQFSNLAGFDEEGVGSRSERQVIVRLFTYLNRIKIYENILELLQQEET